MSHARVFLFAARFYNPWKIKARHGKILAKLNLRDPQKTEAEKSRGVQAGFSRLQIISSEIKNLAYFRKISLELKINQAEPGNSHETFKNMFGVQKISLVLKNISAPKKI